MISQTDTFGGPIRGSGPRLPDRGGPRQCILVEGDAPVVADTRFCEKLPDHVDGAYEDQGGNAFCPLCAGDVNADGLVDFDDIVALLAAWGKCPDCPADFDGDGFVGFGDLLFVLDGWGPRIVALVDDCDDAVTVADGHVRLHDRRREY